jgi:tetratricopeptide (TPR) repeat protein
MKAIQLTAGTLEVVHSSTGLPWWASIPLCTLSMRLALLPLSIRQATIVRTNYAIYKEAVLVTDRKIGEQWRIAGSAHSSSSSLKQPSSSPTQDEKDQAVPQLSVAQRLHRSRLILSTFSELRRKCDIPHPSWILINPLIQLPPFVATGVALRMMALAHWPGLETQGALWFPDLTLVPLVVETLEQPMGTPGLIMPSVLVAMTLTSLRLGFGATNASRLYEDKEASSLAKSHEGDKMDPLGTFLKVLPPVLYSLAILNGYFKVQLPHAALLHWLSASAFTLGLQLGLKNPALRSVTGIPTPKQIHLALKSASASLTNSFASSSSSAAKVQKKTYPMDGPLYSTSTLSPDVISKVATQSISADVLVVLGAQLSAKHQYPEALYCLDRALSFLSHDSSGDLTAGGETQHLRMRAHYSRGQVFSLVGRWKDAESCYRSAEAEAAKGSLEQAQSLHCVATCLHQQGKLNESVEEYRRAVLAMPKSGINRMAVIFSLANALCELGDYSS